jgi:hypothetical protein
MKSAYHLILESNAQARDGSSEERVEDPLWRNIWRLQVAPPPLVRQFCWSICNNLLPTKNNLALRKIAPNPDCPICLREPETVVHCLWSCPSAVAVWQEGSRRLRKLALSATDGQGLVSQLFDKLTKEEVVEAQVVARMIWLRRNTFVFEKKFSSPVSVMENSKQSLANFTEAYYSRNKPPEVNKSPQTDGLDTLMEPRRSTWTWQSTKHA